MAELCLLTIIGIFCFFLIVLKCIYSYNTFWKYIMRMPGPTYYPVVGNLMEVMKDTETMFTEERERCKQYYPLYRLAIFHLAVVTLISPEDIELVMTNMKHIEKNFMYKCMHNWLGTGLLTSTGSKWQSRRKILTPAFHFNILQEFVDIFNKETKHLVEYLSRECGKPYIDVVKPITEFTLCSMGETSLGVNLNGDNSTSYKEAIYDFGHILMERITSPWLSDDNIYDMTSLGKKEKGVVKILHSFSSNIIEKRKKLFKVEENVSYSTRKRLAMLDLLLKMQNDGADLDDTGIREEVDTFMFEGHDTTAVALGYILLALANEQNVQEEVLREIHETLDDSSKPPSYKDLMKMKYMERCIKECLRLFPSVSVIGRIAGEEFTTHSGYVIPKGANININIFDLHRVTKFWENPDKFDPDRFLPENSAKRHPFAYLPFSAGPRNCIGQRFAILEIKAALCGILRKFHLEPIDTYQDMKFKCDLVLRSCGEVRVKFSPRLQK